MTTTSSHTGAMRRLRIIIASLVAVLFGAATLTACASSTTESAPASTTDAETPRVVALDWRYEEILEAIGVKPVGIVEIGSSLEPPTLEGKLDGITSVGQAKQPNLEVIQSLEPDLILASPTRHESIMPQLEEIAKTQSYSDATYTDVLDAMDDIANEVGGDAPQNATEVRERIEGKITEAKDKVAPGSRTALIGWTDNVLYTWIENSFAGSLLKATGYEYGYNGDRSSIESKTDVAELTGDKLPEMDLDVMYLYNDIDGFKASPYADVVETIVDVDQDTWSRSRGPLAAEAMVDQIIASTQK